MAPAKVLQGAVRLQGFASFPTPETPGAGGLGVGGRGGQRGQNQPEHDEQQLFHHDSISPMNALGRGSQVPGNSPPIQF
jgi:hypothetical protein